MSRKKFLMFATLATVIVGLCVVAYVFVSAMNPSAAAKANATVVLEIGDLEPGELRTLVVRGKPLFVYKPSRQSLADLEKLDEHVWRPSRHPYDSHLGAFIYWGLSTRTMGCALEHKPKGDSRLTLDPLYGNPVWYGGFFDPCQDSSYDYAGRAIMDWAYTYNGFNADVDDLSTPRYEAGKGYVRLAVP